MLCRAIRLFLRAKAAHQISMHSVLADEVRGESNTVKEL